LYGRFKQDRPIHTRNFKYTTVRIEEENREPAAHPLVKPKTEEEQEEKNVCVFVCD
jgi:hypothetical protein